MMLCLSLPYFVWAGWFNVGVYIVARSIDVMLCLSLTLFRMGWLVQCRCWEDYIVARSIDVMLCLSLALFRTGWLVQCRCWEDYIVARSIDVMLLNNPISVPLLNPISYGLVRSM